jgi:hypothetical protein
MALQNRNTSSDKKFVKIQTRKVISAYGGSGSLIETPYGALMIEDFDRWPFFKGEYKDGQWIINITSAFHINDERLLQRLNHKSGFSRLEAFVHVPDNVSSSKRADIPENEDETISAIFFPKWFYCNKCECFKPINQWWDIWKNVKGRTATKKDFAPPKCGICYEKSEKKYAPELEQLRFIMTSPDGEIKDIPWELWTTAQKAVKDEDSENGSILLDYGNPCCDKQDLRYLKSNKFSDLAGIRIKCVNDDCEAKGREINLAGLFGLRVFKKYLKDDEGNKIQKEGKDVRVFFKPVIRTSNSVYYPIMVSSIFLPTDKGIIIEDQESIDEWINENEDVDFIFRALKKKYPIDVIKKYIDNKQVNQYAPELEYRLTEYNFLTKSVGPKYEDPSRNLIFNKVEISNLIKLGIEQLIGIKKLKITSVQTGFTRQEPMTSDVFMSDTGETYTTIEGKFTSKWKLDTKYLPAVESFGEGIFIAFSNEQIEKWIDNSLGSQSFLMRVNTLFQNAINHEYKGVREKFLSERHLARFVLIHTISHILIKELEFLCGYPATSLNERLFIDEQNMQGLLIYTVAGAEGSFGGLVSQATEQQITRILKSALNRASDCASDPICYNTDDGQGIGGLNMAACYSCTLVPENACEEFNSFLDRALLIDKDYGFFKNL